MNDTNTAIHDTEEDELEAWYEDEPVERTPEEEALVRIGEVAGDGMHWFLFDEETMDDEESEELRLDLGEIGIKVFEAMGTEIMEIVSDTEYVIRVTLPDDLAGYMREHYVR